MGLVYFTNKSRCIKAPSNNTTFPIECLKRKMKDMKRWLMVMKGGGLVGKIFCHGRRGGESIRGVDWKVVSF